MYNYDTGNFAQSESTKVDPTPDGDTVKEGFVIRVAIAISEIYDDLNILRHKGSIGLPDNVTLKVGDDNVWYAVDATEEVRGIAKIATSDEIDKGTSKNTIVAPYYLKVLDDFVKKNDGISLRFGTTTKFTESGEYTVPQTGMYKLVVGGGGGASCAYNSLLSATNGGATVIYRNGAIMAYAEGGRAGYINSGYGGYGTVTGVDALGYLGGKPDVTFSTTEDERTATVQYGMYAGGAGGNLLDNPYGGQGGGQGGTTEILLWLTKGQVLDITIGAGGEPHNSSSSNGVAGENGLALIAYVHVAKQEYIDNWDNLYASDISTISTMSTYSLSSVPMEDEAPIFNKD